MSLDTERLVENETAIGFDGRDLLAEIELLQALIRSAPGFARADTRDGSVYGDWLKEADAVLDG